MKLTHKHIFLYSGVVVSALIIASIGLAYFSMFRDPITVSLKRVYPQAFIGSRLISLNDVEEAGIVASKFGLSEKQGQEQYFKYEKKLAVARSLKVTPKADAAADEMRYYTKGNEGEYETLLKNTYGNSERIFYKYQIYPQVTDAVLRMKYYQDIKNTNAAYKKASDVLARLKKGEKFEDLAKAESDDKISGTLGGDLGFYESGQILPELEDQISISKLGEFRNDVVISRLGYHLVYPVEYSNIGGKKLWHAKHILFVPEGYESWLEKQTNQVDITYLKK